MNDNKENHLKYVARCLQRHHWIKKVIDLGLDFEKEGPD